MPTQQFTPTRITLAATNTEAMVRFYDALFGAGLTPVAAHGTTLYRGRLGDVAFVICPNELAGVDAQQSRHQYTYAVPSLDDVVARAITLGGVVHQASAAATQSRTTVILDPDGNSIVFVEAEH